MFKTFLSLLSGHASYIRIVPQVIHRSLRRMSRLAIYMDGGEAKYFFTGNLCSQSLMGGKWGWRYIRRH